MFQEVIRNLPHGLRNILSDNDVGLKWHKQSLSDNFTIKKEDLDITIVHFNRGYRGNRGQVSDWGYSGDMKFSPSTDVLFFYDDVGHGSHSRMTHFVETSGDAVRNQYLIKTENRKLLKKFSKALGNVTVQPVSNLPKRPKAVRQARRVTSKVLEYTGRHHDRRDSWNPTELDLKTGGIYVMINRFKVFDGNTPSHGGGTYENEVTSFDSIVELAKENNIIDLTGKVIYGIRKGDVAKLKDDSGWINLFDLIRDKLAVAVKKERVAQILADRTAYQSFSCDIENFLSELDRSQFAKGTPMAIFLHANDYMKGRNSDRASAISEVAGKVSFRIKDATAKHDLGLLWKAVQEQYPLIKMLSDNALQGGYYRENETKADRYASLIEYMELLDKKNSKPSANNLKAA